MKDILEGLKKIMQLGIRLARERVYRIAMKHEYKSRAFMPSNVGKHYFVTAGTPTDEYADYIKRLAKIKTLSREERIKLSFDKVRLNGHSGAHAPVSMPLFNKITHSSLTAACRAANGYSDEQPINPSKE